MQEINAEVHEGKTEGYQKLIFNTFVPPFGALCNLMFNYLLIS